MAGTPSGMASDILGLAAAEGAEESGAGGRKGDEDEDADDDEEEDDKGGEEKEDEDERRHTEVDVVEDDAPQASPSNSGSSGLFSFPNALVMLERDKAVEEEEEEDIVARGIAPKGVGGAAPWTEGAVPLHLPFLGGGSGEDEESSFSCRLTGEGAGCRCVRADDIVAL